MVDELASDPLAAGDRECQTEILTAYLSLGKPDAALAFAARRNLPAGGEQALIVAQCHYATGDARSAEAVLLGSLLRGETLSESTARAVDFIQKSVARTLAAGTPMLEGVQFEPLLRELL